MKKHKLFSRLQFALVVGLLGTALSAQAAPITGDLNITGSVRVTAGGLIDFLDDSFMVVAPNTGSFAGLEGSTGTIGDLQAGAPLPMNGWLTLASLPSFTFTLQAVQPGVFSSAQCGMAPAPGQVCTPPELAPGIPSPFNLVNLVNSATASFSLSGTVTDPTGPFSAFSGTFTTQFDSPGLRTFQDVLQRLNEVGFVEASYSATISTTPSEVPEPGTTSLIIMGGMALVTAGVVRRKKA